MTSNLPTSENFAQRKMNLAGAGKIFFILGVNAPNEFVKLNHESAEKFFLEVKILPDYERPKDVSVKDIAEGAATLLVALFSEAAFSDAEKRMYRFACAGSIESFIYRELFKYTGVINFETTANAGKDSELLYRMVTVYFLHCRYNAKLGRGNKDEYTLKALDNYLYRVICGAATDCEKSFHMNENKFFDVVSKSSFVLILSHARYVWDASNYFAQDKDCVQVTLSIT